jgi:hypothetical protein
MSAANERVTALLDQWLASVELHARYAELDDADYAKVQDWPTHQRPTKWVLELARVRLLELKRHLNERRAKGDIAFLESLELMSFLTQLLGSEHVDRFIPLAKKKQNASASGTVKRPRLRVADGKPATQAAATERREVAPRPASTARRRATSASAPVMAATVSASVRPNGTASPPAAAPAKPAAIDAATATVIADAARLLSWGREWPSLAGLIARLADRPPEPEVWKILRTHRDTIERKARSARD